MSGLFARRIWPPALTSFAYEERDRVIERTDPLGNPETFAYDDNGNLRFATDRMGQVIEFRYDEANRLKAKVMLPGANEKVRDFDYDDRDNLTLVADSDSRLDMTYDRLNRLQSVSTALAPFQPDVLLDYAYDANGNRTTMTGPTGQTDYSYDLLDLLTGMTDPANQPTVDAIAFGYDVLGRRTGTTLPDGADAALGYDLAGRLTSLANTVGAAAISSYGFTLNKVGSRTEMTQARSAVSVASPLAYGYDDLEQVESATNPIPGNPDESFIYDPLGNRLRRDGQVFDSIIGAGNRLLEDEQFCYVYDLNGNLETKTVKLPGDCTTGGTTTFFYDPENRLVQIGFPDASVAAYRYDGLGRRIEKTANGATTRYVYDREDILLEYDGANTLVARYTHGPGIDEPLIMARDLNGDGAFAATERFAYHRDGLGSITELTDNAGTVAVAYVYDSFGQILAQAGSLANPYTYTGRELDTESGLYFYRARYYVAGIGRFLAEDPIGFAAGDGNPYRYVRNNPITFTDPAGLLTFVVGGGVSLVVGGGVEASAGAALTLPSDTDCQAFEFGRFVTTAAGLGLNVSADVLFVGAFKGNISDLDSASQNFNIVLGPVSISAFVTPRTGEFQGITIGGGPSIPGLPEVQGSITEGTTDAETLFEGQKPDECGC